jgi:hypothetical protein
MATTLGFLGGTGIEGKGLALRFARAGANIIIGSRSRERAEATAQQYNDIAGQPVVQGMANKEMLAAAQIVFLTVPADQVDSAVDSSRGDFAPGLILVDVTVPVRFQEGRAEYLEREEGSNAERIAARVPDHVSVVGAFKTLPAHVLAELDTPLQCDMFVCGDSREAREKIIEVARLIPTLRPLDAGPLSAARTLERMTVLAIHLNRRYKKKSARYSVVGL